MNDLEIATFGGGCFWGVEETFRQLEGVKETVVGYMGEHTQSPTYEDVCSDETGHAEVVQIKFDPTEISYEALLRVFWKSHDPTTPNRQGPDVGSQYRSVIFYHTPEQKQKANDSRVELEKSRAYSRPIVTEIVAAGDFFRAEDYHQRYLAKRGQASCHI